MMRRKVWIAALLISSAFGAVRFETYQLPLSDFLLKTFPRLRCPYFIIVCPQLGIVVHEANSNVLLRCGTFSELIFSNALRYKFGKRTPQISQLNKREIIDDFLIKFGVIFPEFTDLTLSRDGELISLHDMCRLYIFSGRRDYFLFRSQKIEHGIAFFYKTKRDIEFVCLLFGAKSEDVIKSDVRLICQWLEQFRLKKSETKIQLQIPVFYGTTNLVSINAIAKSCILGVDDRPERVLRTARYMMRLMAPVSAGDQVGWIFFQTKTFKNPIKVPIRSNANIPKASPLKCLHDSISFIIYNHPG